MTDRKIALGLFAMTLFASAYFFSGGGWNQNANLDLTRAIVERGTLYIDGYHRNTGDVAVVGSHVYSNKPPGISFLAAIPYAAIRAVRREDPDEWKVLTRNAWLLTVLVCGTMAASTSAVLFLLLARMRQVSKRWSLLIAVVVAFATPMLAYSTMLFIHVPSALLTLLGYVWSRDPRNSRGLLAGVATGLNALCNFTAIPLLPIYLLRTSWPGGGRFRRAVLFVAGAAPFLALFSWYQFQIHGTIFRNPARLNPAFTRADAPEVLGAPSLEAFLGITISPYRGLFFLSPVLVFALAGLVAMIRRRVLADALTIAAVSAVFVGVNICFNNWDGGSATGPRYILPIIPLLGVAMSYVAGWWKPLWIALAIVSLSHNVVATAVDPQAPITVENPLFDYQYPLLFFGSVAPDIPIQPSWMRVFLTGHTSVNRQSMNEILPMILYAPGSHESGWASFNLGEYVFGAGSPWSLLLFAVVFLGGVLLLMRLVRDEREGGKNIENGSVGLTP